MVMRLVRPFRPSSPSGHLALVGGVHMLRRMILVGTGLMLMLALASSPARAQITTGTVSGSVKDAQGGVIPGATVVLISEARGTKSAPAVTNETGTYVFPNVTADTYTIEVSLQAFKTVKRGGV